MAPGPRIAHHPTAASSDDPSSSTSFPAIPPFPADVPTCPLLRISLARLLAGDEAEEDRLWQACRDVGFFYIDLRTETGGGGEGRDGGAAAVGAAVGAQEGRQGLVDGQRLLRDADGLFGVQERFFRLPVEEKVRYDFSGEGSYFGYKGYGGSVIDKTGTPDRNEFYNISKDDILEHAPPLPAPSLLTPHRPLLASYITQSHALVALILNVLNTRLGLPPGTLAALHRLDASSGDQVRFIRAPPQPPDDRRTALGEHTDFGSVTVLFNRVGGLQVLLPKGVEPVGGGSSTEEEKEAAQDGNEKTETWAYVRPLPNHAIVNLGDALVTMTAGLLRSNIHRVAPPPGAQAAVARHSLVYFARPEDDVPMCVLEGSELIEKQAMRSGARAVKAGGQQEVSAKDWVLRRAMARKTGGRYEDGLGTEELSRMR